MLLTTPNPCTVTLNIKWLNLPQLMLVQTNHWSKVKQELLDSKTQTSVVTVDTTKRIGIVNNHLARRVSLKIGNTCHFPHLEVSINRGTPKSSILLGFSRINQPFWGKPPWLWKPSTGGTPFDTSAAPLAWLLHGREPRKAKCWQHLSHRKTGNFGNRK